MRRIHGLAILMAWLIGTPLLAQDLTPNRAECAGVLPSRLTVGGLARVLPGDAISLRAEPAASAARVGRVPGARSVQVIGGPRCVESAVWWEIRSDALTGWTPETSGDVYWLEPFADGVFPALVLRLTASAGVFSVAIAGDTLAYGLDDGTIALWMADAPAAQLTGHSGRVTALLANPVNPNQLASASTDGTVRVWDIAARAEIAAYPISEDSAPVIGFASNGMTLAASAGDQTVVLLDPNGQGEIMRFDATTPGIDFVAFTPNPPRGRLLAVGINGSAGGQIEVWDIDGRNLIYTLSTQPLRALTFRLDRVVYLQGDAAEPWVWTLGDALPNEIDADGFGAPATTVQINSRGSLIVSGSLQTGMRFWRVAADRVAYEEWARLVPAFSLPAGALVDLAFNDDGTLLAGADTSGYVYLWDLTGARPFSEG